MHEEVIAAIARIPILAGIERGRLRVQRLGGLTNRVYRLDHDGGTCVLRIPGEGTETYIDREAEACDATVAAAAGVSAPVLFADPPSGLMVTAHIDGITMNVERFRDTGAVARAGVALRRMHRCGGQFRNRFELFEKIDEYLALVRALGATLPEGYEAVRREADAVRRVLSARPLPRAPCHCDPLAENFIDTGTRMYVVDWEYAGMNDPMWDLGDLSVEAALGPEQDEALLAAYFDGRVPSAERGRMVLYKAMCDLLWTLWGVVQHAHGNPAEDFETYALGRFRRCRALMAEPVFADSLHAVERG